MRFLGFLVLLAVIFLLLRLFKGGGIVASRQCPHCGQRVPEIGVYCPICGQRVV
jgi:hypothetical protein